MMACTFDTVSIGSLVSRHQQIGVWSQGADFDSQPTVDKSVILELRRLGFVQRHNDLVITGQHGTGKSHFLEAFALRARQQGLS